MKLALYLLSCCIAVSWQQNPHLFSPYRAGGHPPAARQGYGYGPAHFAPYSPQYYGAPAAPSSYLNRYLASYYQQIAEQRQAEQAEQAFLARLLIAQKLASINKEKEASKFDHDQAKGDEIAARVAASLLGGKGKDGEEDPESRSFLLPALFYKQQIYSTKTSYSFTTSTITSTVVISCINANSFYGGSSQACRRKRDSPAELRSAVAEKENDDGSLVNPSPVESMETTALVAQPSVRSADIDPSIIVEGKQDNNESLLDRVRMFLANNNPNARSGFFGSTYTSTVTTYSILTTASKKTVSIGSSLSCLPVGYSIC